MPKYALINEDDLVVNIILWDGVTDWSPPAGLTAIEDVVGNAQIGDTYDGETFVAPPAPEPEPEV